MAKQGQADRFHQGTMTDGWRWFGAHPAKKRGREGWTFRVWAPHAEAVSVIGDFNDWQEGAAPLSRKGEIWEGFLPDLPVVVAVQPFQPVPVLETEREPFRGGISREMERCERIGGLA